MGENDRSWRSTSEVHTRAYEISYTAYPRVYGKKRFQTKCDWSRLNWAAIRTSLWMKFKGRGRGVCRRGGGRRKEMLCSLYGKVGSRGLSALHLHESNTKFDLAARRTINIPSHDDLAPMALEVASVPVETQLINQSITWQLLTRSLWIAKYWNWIAKLHFDLSVNVSYLARLTGWGEVLGQCRLAYLLGCLSGRK